MTEFEIEDKGDNDYTVTNKDNGDEFEVHLSHYGSPEVNRVSASKSGGNLLGLFLLLWIALIFVMPVIFFTEKIYTMDSSPIIFIIAYLFVLGSFILTFIPSVTKIKAEKLKKYGKVLLYVFNYLILVFALIVYFTQTKEDSQFLFIYFLPLAAYMLIVYHIKDFNIIPLMMKKLKIKKYSFIAVYIIQWLAIVVLFYFAIMMPFGDKLGDFLAFIICYMYMIIVDIKKILLYRKRII